jgi:iron complex outermembrane recepter protein
VLPAAAAGNTALATTLATNAGLVRLLSGLTIPGVGGFRAIAAGALGNPTLPLAGVAVNDTFRQKSRNYAFFTHNVVKFTDALSLTLGLRYTNERKTLDATLIDNNAYCRAIRASTLVSLSGIPCAINALPGGNFVQNGQVKSEDKLTGTAVLSWKPIDSLLTYASFSRGYKAGGFNLDRASLLPATPNLAQLTFDPEVVDAYEIGAKLNLPGFDLNVAVFKQDFKGFQLNAFNGLNFAVTNLNACSADLGGRDTDNSDAAFPCPGRTKPGVVSQGVEIEAFMRPARDVGVNFGVTYTDTAYRNNLLNGALSAVGAGQFQLPGQRLSNSSEFVITGAATWTPPIGNSGLSGLLYTDFRYQSATNTGSDLDFEKVQPGFIVVNARVGIRGPENRWGIELWAQNLLDTDYQQIAFDATLQPAGGGTTRGVQRGFYPFSNQIFNAFLGEPRTYGVTARFKF